jgi:membrane protein
VTRPFAKFFADRGTHLAAMIAYFALLSMVPLVFLALALLGLFGRADETSLFVQELELLFPSQEVSDIVGVVRSIQRNAATLGIVGAAFLLWTSLSLFSVLESAFNIVYGLPNRSFLRGKALAVLLMASSLILLFVGLVVGSFGYELLDRFAPALTANAFVGYALPILVSTGAVFVFLVSVYFVLTNVRLSLREVLPGTVVATVLLQLTFQVLPVYDRYARDPDLIVLRAFGGPVILLIWLYVMANAIVLGAEVNWWRSRRARPAADDEEEVPGLA